MTTALVLGGARSGKSAYAEHLLADRADVTYVAPGPPADPQDADWATRVVAHQARRPTTWTTCESRDLAGLLRRARPGDTLLIDCLGTWLTHLADAAQCWQDAARARQVWAESGAELARGLQTTTADVVLVTNETGLGVVPATASGRLFRDGLGHLNTVVAGVCDHVALVVAGRVLDLSDSPRLADAPRLGARG